jgi:hypothetical protein
MKTVELYARVRHAVLIEGISERAAADRFGINARTVSKMLKFSVPPRYVRRKPPLRPKLDEFIGVIDAILAADRERPKKQRHTSQRIFERLRDEHGFYTRVSTDAGLDQEFNSLDAQYDASRDLLPATRLRQLVGDPFGRRMRGDPKP